MAKLIILVVEPANCRWTKSITIETIYIYIYICLKTVDKLLNIIAYRFGNNAFLTDSNMAGIKTAGMVIWKQEAKPVSTYISLKDTGDLQTSSEYLHHWNLKIYHNYNFEKLILKIAVSAWLKDIRFTLSFWLL